MSSIPNKRTALEVLEEAKTILQSQEEMRLRMRECDNRLRQLCREYDSIERMWGSQPHHLRQACEARGLIHVAN